MKTLRILIAALCMAGVLVALQFRASWAADLETKVKVAYIYNFTKFIEWPGNEGDTAGEPVRICVIGSDPIRTTLGELSTRDVRGRPIRIARIRDASAIPQCHLLFISRSEEAQVETILRRLQGTPVVTISDIPRFAQRGGMISFTTENNRVRIEINQRTIRQSGLKVSAKLLEIARIVQ